MSSPATELVAVVTGGNGFLGQHIIQALMKHCAEIREIKVFDKMIYKDKLEPFKQRMMNSCITKSHQCVSRGDPRILSVVGDITDYESVSEACRGADVVFHVLSLVDASLIPDRDALERINVDGTLNVVNACLEHNVRQLIYTSTVDVVIGYEDIINGTETNTRYPDEFLYDSYAETKAHAEKIVLDANGKGRLNQLKTLSLRPPVIYGEADTHFITQMLHSAKSFGGTLIPFGDGKTKWQQAYVGNVAWAHICAYRAVKNEYERESHSGILESSMTSPEIVSGTSEYPDILRGR
ncbi:unnamed protein product [Owenia fusiformis]|uniref:Uncharacterized protein n=1 Tax=Owenia fusiformis TaxID=6347 RepID=A0A8J1TKB7_OWEFU|nr:unnamed protein product [Owenia fusiformis]